MQIKIVLFSCWLALAASSFLPGLDVNGTMDPNGLASDPTGKGRGLFGNIGMAMLGVGAGLAMKKVYDQGGLKWKGAAGNSSHSEDTALVVSSTEAPATITTAPAEK